MLSLLEALDLKIFFWIHHNLAQTWLDKICLVLRNKWVWFPVYIGIAWIVFRIFKEKGWIIIVSALLLVVSTDQLSSSLIKPFFGRLRPCNDPELFKQIRFLLPCGSGFSFVSSHAANHFGLSTFLSFIFKNIKTSAVLFIWAGAIAFSQVYVGLHYPSDVLCGAMVGFFLGWLFALLCRKILQYTDTIGNNIKNHG
ncbi:MAG: phosphatase PAP2 family protein [Chitinophagales bacterium]|nr:phosphatase PAP2 family protein [Chitinophagales bacterium]